MNNIIKDFEELVKSESEFLGKIRPIITPETWKDPIKGIISTMVKEEFITKIIKKQENIYNRYKELLNLVISDKSLPLEQKLQIYNLIRDSWKYLIKLQTSITLIIKRANDGGKNIKGEESLINNIEEIQTIFLEYRDEIKQEAKETYGDLKKKFIQKFGNNPITIKDSCGKDIRIKSCGSDLNIVDKYNYRLSSISGSIESIELILRALKLNPDETKEEKIN